MDDLISRSALINEFKRLTLGENSLIERFFADGVYAVIETFPAVDAVEVKHGRWEKRRFTETWYGYQCSNCRTTWDEGTNFCPNCGADMRERKEEYRTPPITNADRIRNMSDKGLAIFLCDVVWDCHLCSEHTRLDNEPLLRDERCDENCIPHCLEWLKHPYKGGADVEE